MPTIVKEARSTGAPTGARTLITLITPGWGSSGSVSYTHLTLPTILLV